MRKRCTQLAQLITWSSCMYIDTGRLDEQQSLISESVLWKSASKPSLSVVVTAEEGSQSSAHRAITGKRAC